MIESLPNGQKVIAEDSHLSKWAREKGNIVTDPNLFKFLDPFLKRAGVNVIWDVGACIGDHTRHYLDLGKIVVAIEPNPEAFECLEHNCPEAQLLNIAASDTEGTLKFTRLENAGASRITPDGEIEVKAAALDDLGLPAPNLVKVDVEGWEPAALKGMEKTLRLHKPIVFIEVNPGALAANGYHPRDITDAFLALGYSEFQIYPPTASWSSPQFDLLITP